MASPAVKRVTIQYSPRRLFLPYHLRSHRFAAMVAHRRCGKTVACVNDLIARAINLKLQPNWAPGRYAYVAPLLAQAKEVAWEYLKRFAAPIMADKNEGELWVELVNRSRIRCHGADNPDRLRGGYLDGAILDEYADMRPSVLGSVIRPMLADRLGWLTAIGTPKGRNEFHKLYARAQGDPDWFVGCYKASETGLLLPGELAAARKDMTQEEYEQEFECSFDAAIIGAYFSKEIAQAEREGRIRQVARLPGVPVQCAWDLGIGDSMAIWTFQVTGNEIRVLDYYENNNNGFAHYVDWLKSKGYHGEGVVDWVPHDAKVRELGTGKSRIEALEGMGRKLELVPDLGLEDGINAFRLELARMWFDIERCSEGIEALRQYRTQYDEKTKAFSDKPRHDWTSHCADAGRYMAVAARALAGKPAKPEEKPVGLPLDQVSFDDFFDMADAPKRERV